MDLIGLIRRFPFHKKKVFTNIGYGSRVVRENLDGMFPNLVTIGNNCIFAPTAIVLTHDASYYLFTGRYRIASTKIGNNVFVGYNVVIMPGVEIGDNVIIAACSAVTKSVPSNSVVAGVPGRVIASLSEYLQRKRDFELFEPPYAGKSPADIDIDDVAMFQKAMNKRSKNNL